MAIVEHLTAPLEPVLWPEVMMPDAGMLDECVRDTPVVRPPACELMRRIMVTMADTLPSEDAGNARATAGVPRAASHHPAVSHREAIHDAPRDPPHRLRPGGPHVAAVDPKRVVGSWPCACRPPLIPSPSWRARREGGPRWMFLTGWNAENTRKSSAGRIPAVGCAPSLPFTTPSWGRPLGGVGCGPMRRVTRPWTTCSGCRGG
jgi:hypothetical protein